MEAIAVLIGIGALCFYVVAPFLALAAARGARDDAQGLRMRLDQAEDTMGFLRREILALRQRQRELHEVIDQLVAQREATPETQARPAASPSPAPVPTPWPMSGPATGGVPAAEPEKAAPVGEVLWPRPEPPAAPEVPATLEPPAASAEPPVVHEAPAPAADTPPAPANEAPVLSPMPQAPARLPAEIWSRVPSPPPLTPAPAAASPLAPPKPPTAAADSYDPPKLVSSFNLEQFLGVRGAAALGGVALVIAGVLFARYAIENNLIPPALRIAILLVIAIGCIVGAELVLRRGYAATANATAGAGVALLYSSFYAAHGLYSLIPLPVTFALMALTTVVACLLSLRHNASFIAILGLFGGFATPLLLSTGKDRPIGLFSYTLLLDIGVLTIALRRGWTRLAYLSQLATILLLVAWSGKFLTPGKLPLALGLYAGFGLLYLALPLLAKGEQRDELTPGAFIGGFLPFLFALLCAGDGGYAARWPLLAGYDALLSLALCVIALRRGPLILLPAGAAATAMTLGQWAPAQLRAGGDLAVAGTAVALAVLYHIPAALRSFAPALLRRLRPDELTSSGVLIVEAAALILSGTVYFLALSLGGHGHGAGVFLALLGALFVFSLAHTRGALPHSAAMSAPLLALLVQRWLFSVGDDSRLLRDLAVPVLLGAAQSLDATVLQRARHPGAAPAGSGTLAALLISLTGLLFCITHPALAAAPLPLFLTLTVLTGLVLIGTLRDDRAWLWPVTLCIAAGFSTFWEDAALSRADLPIAAPFIIGLYLFFLVAPGLPPVAQRASWLAGRSLPLAAAASGPVFFFALYRLWVLALGKSAQGALALLLAAASVLGLFLQRRRFLASGVTPAPEVARARLRALALLAAVSVGFISVAIPLQLEREWITLGWALEAAAVWWLYRRLPHPGLRYLGLGLYLTVAARLLLNPAVLTYHDRGWPIFNWILYTYGVSALCFLGGAAALAQSEPVDPAERPGLERALLPPWLRLPTLARGLALLLLFALLNLEIADYFSPGRRLELYAERGAARDLTTSVAWGLYALLLLGIGVSRGRVLRFVSLAFMLLTITKVFLYDLSSLRGLYQVLSFLGLALSLIMVSLLYQRFVFRATDKDAPGAPSP